MIYFHDIDKYYARMEIYNQIEKLTLQQRNGLMMAGIQGVAARKMVDSGGHSDSESKTESKNFLKNRQGFKLLV